MGNSKGFVGDMLRFQMGFLGLLSIGLSYFRISQEVRPNWLILFSKSYRALSERAFGDLRRGCLSRIGLI